MPNWVRKDNGQPIRDAMRRKKLSGPALAAATKDADAAGKGISPATVGKIAGTGRTAHDEARPRTAWLLALGLNEPLQDLFDLPGVSTATDERLKDDAQDAR